MFHSRWIHWDFSLIYSLRSHYDSEIDSSSNINDYREYLLGGKGGRCVELTTLSASCADCLEILGAPNTWTPKGLSRPVQIDLAFALVMVHCVKQKMTFEKGAGFIVATYPVYSDKLILSLCVK